ncbi:MAG: hydrolase, partial [Bacteroidales bacterium]|nr:hydrolase [Bacteroidales bacterium]
MERTEALELLKKYVKNEKMLIHSLEAEAVMRAL